MCRRENSRRENVQKRECAEERIAECGAKRKLEKALADYRGNCIIGLLP
jgi:hypothetical protein